MDDNRNLHLDIQVSTLQPGPILGVQEVTRITFGPASTAGLNGKVITFYDTPTTTVGYFFDINNSSIAAPGGLTRTVRVNLINSDTASIVAGKFETAIKTDPMLYVSLAGAVATVTNAIAGVVPNATTNTGFAISTTVQGVDGTQPTLPAYVAPDPGQLIMFSQMGSFGYVDPLLRRHSLSVFGRELVVGPSQAYPTVQAALAAANSGDRIKVLNGTYNGDIAINKPNIFIIGEGKGAILNGDISFNTGSDYAYVTNLYLMGSLRFTASAKYVMVVYNWISKTSTIVDDTVVTSVDYTYRTHAANTLPFEYFASANTVADTYAEYLATLPTIAHLDLFADTFASKKITTDTIAYKYTTYETHANAAAAYSAYARASRASNTFAYADTTYAVKATGSALFGTYSSANSIYSVKAFANTAASTFAKANSTFSTFASGTHDGVTFTANTLGIGGNSISLVFDGIADIDTVVAAAGNTVSHNGVGTDVLSFTTLTLIGGADNQPVIFTADKIGVNGNSISLPCNGTDSLSVIVDAWNGLNVGNEVSHDGNPNGVPPAGTITLAGGTDGNAVTITSVTAGTFGNSTSVSFDGVLDLDTSIELHNASFPGNEVTYVGDATSIVPLSTVTLAGGTSGNAVTFTSMTPGTLGNTISLVFDGVEDIQTVVTRWNQASTGNQVSFTGNGAGVIASSTVTLSGAIGGTIAFSAKTPGVGGNSISLIFNGVQTVDAVVTAWNLANDQNQVDYSGGPPTSVISAQTVTLTGGVATTAVRFKAELPGVNGNTIVLVFNGTATIKTVVDAWNLANGGKKVFYSGPDNGIVPASTVTLANGKNSAAYTFTSTQIGAIGNNVSLVFDGIRSLGTIVSEWNSLNDPDITYTPGASSADILIAQTINLVGGSDGSPVTFTADQLGIEGNVIILTFNGTDNIQTVVNYWNGLNGGNAVNHNGNPLGIVPASTVSLSGGMDATEVMFYAETSGAGGNAISLTFNGSTDSIASVTGAWNSLNTGNKVLVLDDFNQPNGVPLAGTYVLEHGADDVTITWAAETIGNIGNVITLIHVLGDTLDLPVSEWNTNNIGNEVTQDQNPLYQIPPQTIVLSGGSNSGTISFFAVTPGVIGNSISIVADGIKTVGQLQTEWNAGHQSNQVRNNAANQDSVPIAGTHTLLTGSDAVVFLFRAKTLGVVGNSIVLTFDGMSVVSDVVTLWNDGHLTNQVATSQPSFVLGTMTITLSGGQDDIPTTFTAVEPGVIGNAISLVFDGTSDIQTVVDMWNAGHLNNQVAFTVSGSAVVAASTVTLQGGQVGTVYTFTAVELGTIGNSITLNWNGTTQTIQQAVDIWNGANNLNRVGYAGGPGTFVVPTPTVLTLTGGQDSTPVTFTALYAGNGFELIYDGAATIQTVVDDWNRYNPASAVGHNGRPEGVPPEGVVRLVVGGDNNMWILISEM